MARKRKHLIARQYTCTKRASSKILKKVLHKFEKNYNLIALK